VVLTLIQFLSPDSFTVQKLSPPTFILAKQELTIKAALSSLLGEDYRVLLMILTHLTHFS
jgi:hypothetical protein